MDALNEVRPVCLQAVIIVEYDDGRMYPIVEDRCPKCLLPVANRELLAYQLDMLAKSGMTEVYIVAPSDYQPSLSAFLHSDHMIHHGSMTVELVVVDNMTGSVDGLRAIAERLRGDFVTISADSFCKVPLGPLVAKHNLKSADVTMLLTSAPYDEADKKGGSKKARLDSDDREIIVFNDDDRVFVKLPLVDVEADTDKGGCVELHKALLHYGGNLALKTDLIDLGIYVFSYWVLELIAASGTGAGGMSKFVSIQADLIPFLIRRQLQPADEVLREIPALQNRQRTLAALEPWVIASTSAPIDINEGKSFELVDFLAAEMANTDSLTGGVSSCLIPSDADSAGGLRHAPSSQRSMTNSPSLSLASPSSQGVNSLRAGVSKTSANGILSFAKNSYASTAESGAKVKLSPVHAGALNTSEGVSVRDVLRCYALFYDERTDGENGLSQAILGGPENAHTFIPSALNTSPASSADSISGPCLMLRLTSIPSYICLNKELPSAPYNSSATPWPRIQGYAKKEQSVIGAQCTIRDKVTIKTCTIGPNCTIGAKSKINNSILMADVTLGEGVVIQNSVICAGAVVESGCNLNDVGIGAKAKIVANSKLKGELIGGED